MAHALCRPLSGRLLSSLIVIQPRFAFAAAARTRNLSFLGIWTTSAAGVGSLNPTRSSGIRIRSAHVNDAGSIDSPTMLSMETKIKQQLDAESVCVKDASGDGRHVSIDVVASCFEGKSAVNRQRMVYKAIWEELQTTVHAVDQMTTRTLAEVSDK